MGIIYKKRFSNPETGEFETISLQSIHKRFPQKGSEGVYMSNDENKMVLPKIAMLTPKEAILLEKMIKDRNKYNVVKTKQIQRLVKDTQLSKWSRSYLSQRMKKLQELDLVKKYNNRWIINPFIVKPKFDEDDPDSQWICQQIYKKLFIDKDAFVPDFMDRLEEMFEN